MAGKNANTANTVNDPGTQWPEGAKQLGFVMAAAWGMVLFALAMLTFYAVNKQAEHRPGKVVELPADAQWLVIPDEGGAVAAKPKPPAPVAAPQELAPEPAPGPASGPASGPAPEPVVVDRAQASAAKPALQPAEKTPAPTDEMPQEQVAQPVEKAAVPLEPVEEAAPASEPEVGRMIEAQEAPAAMQASPEKTEAETQIDKQDNTSPPPQTVGKVFLVLLGGGDNIEILDAAPAGAAIVLTDLGEGTAGFVAAAMAQGVKVLVPLVFGQEAPLPTLEAAPLENRARLKKFLDDMPEMDGLYLVPNHPFFQKPESLRMMLAEIAARGMGVVGYLPQEMAERFPALPYIPVDGGLTPAPADDLAAQMGALGQAKGKGAGLSITAPTDPDLLQALQQLVDEGRAEFYRPNGL